MKSQSLLHFRKSLAYLFLSLICTQPLFAIQVTNKLKTKRTIHCVVDMGQHSAGAKSLLPNKSWEWSAQESTVNKSCGIPGFCKLYCAYESQNWGASLDINWDNMKDSYNVNEGEKYPHLKIEKI